MFICKVLVLIYINTCYYLYTCYNVIYILTNMQKNKMKRNQEGVGRGIVFVSPYVYNTIYQIRQSTKHQTDYLADSFCKLERTKEKSNQIQE